jgi:hypothetical protein
MLRLVHATVGIRARLNPAGGAGGNLGSERSGRADGGSEVSGVPFEDMKSTVER